jgi:phosphoribosylglycinamide formyltransferase-1
MAINLGFYVTNNGTTVEKIQEKINEGYLKDFQNSVIICNKDQAGIYERAKRLGIPIYRALDDVEQKTIFQEHSVELILSLGYMQKIGDEVLGAFPNHVWNIHHSAMDLKGLCGKKLHEAVLASGRKNTGLTIHIMDGEIDSGDVIAYNYSVLIDPNETVESLMQKVTALEYILVPETLLKYARNEIKMCRHR